MNYETLADERAGLQVAIDNLLAGVLSANPRARSVSARLRTLVGLVRDHLSRAEPIVYAAADAARGGRHCATAAAALAALDGFKNDWCQYLYRWDADAVARDLPRFAEETTMLLTGLERRVVQEVSILLSLAVHHRVLPPGA